MKKISKTDKWIIWTPRVLSILLIIFISMFALDIFSEGYNLIDLLIGLFMHLIPTFILIFATLISWKFRFHGGLFYIILAGVATIFFKSYEDPIVFLIVILPIIIIGSLYILSWYVVDKSR